MARRIATNALQGGVVDSTAKTRASTSASASIATLSHVNSGGNGGNWDEEDESSSLSEPPSDLEFSDEEEPTMSKYFQTNAPVKKVEGLGKEGKKKGAMVKVEVKDEEDEWRLSGMDEKMKREVKKEPTPEMGDLAPELIKKELENGEIQDIKPVAKGRAGAKTKARGGSVAGVEPPKHWEEMYDLVKEMRSRIQAPVDTMGCERLAKDDASPKDNRFQTLISLMLSSQTKDTVNAIAMKNLQTGLPGGLCLESILAVDERRLDELIRPVGFHNRKTQYIKKAALLLRDQFGGDIPGTFSGLTSLPGVGPKMAHLCLSAAWNRTEGIGVDVHVHRITNLWGWVKTTTPEGTREALEAWLPRDRWREINYLLVGFGQTVCLPRGRKCGECMLAERGICRAAFVGDVAGKKGGKRKVGKVEESDGSDGEFMEGWDRKMLPVKRIRRKVVKVEEAESDAEVESERPPPPKRTRRRMKVEAKGEDVGDIEDGGIRLR